MVMGKIGIASWPFWLKTRTRIDKDEVPLSTPWDHQRLGELTHDRCRGLWPKWLRMPRLLGAAASRGLQSGHAPHVWQSGYRSGASIQALSTARLHQGSCPSRQSRRRFGLITTVDQPRPSPYILFSLISHCCGPHFRSCASPFGPPRRRQYPIGMLAYTTEAHTAIWLVQRLRVA